MWMTRHAIVVTAISKEHIKPMHDRALEIFGRDSDIPDCPVPWKGENGRKMVSSIVSGVMNGDASFFIGPDGSKEGWGHSHEGDRRRAEFVAWLRADERYCYWAELYYGDDDQRCKIVDHSGKAMT